MSASPQRCRLVALLSCALLASACTAPPRSYVALLPDASGNVGRLSVQSARGAQTLTQANQAALIDGSAPGFVVSPEQLQKDFGAALSASPVMPEQFFLYFDSGGSALTADSEKLLVLLLERSKNRLALDLSVVGHTDTQGTAESNETLALQRAQSIAARLSSMGIPGTVISIESHGERNLLVLTPDEADEPRNRRVEVTLR